VAGAGGVLGGQVWKVATFALLGLLLAGGAAGGTLWWSAAAARDQALADLKAEKGITAELRAGVDVQNRAIVQWHEQAKVAEARGTAARQAAEANGRRYDQALQQIAGARATTCDEAMPYVNKVLESVR
jgi:hypothetical protein